MWVNPQIVADLVAFTEEIVTEKQFLCSAMAVKYKCKVNEDEIKNTNNSNEAFNNLKNAFRRTVINRNRLTH